jgi:hypothetical protein
VHLGEPEGTPGFGIAVDIEVEGVSDEQLIQNAHAVCIVLSWAPGVFESDHRAVHSSALTQEHLVMVHK